MKNYFKKKDLNLGFHCSTLRNSKKKTEIVNNVLKNLVKSKLRHLEFQIHERNNQLTFFSANKTRKNLSVKFIVHCVHGH